MNSLDEIAKQIKDELILRFQPQSNITEENAKDVQMLCIAEETGELVGAYRRWTGRARRNGNEAEVRKEIADVLITTAIFAYMNNWDIETLLQSKAHEIMHRGWKENA